MTRNDVLILRAREISRLLRGRERDIMSLVAKAYRLHSEGRSFLPQSSFVHFPGNDRNRIIALPAYLGGDVDSVGIKWVSSFPNNHKVNLDRASALIILNSVETGRPEVILEGSIISAKRTAASAALAARFIPDGEQASGIGIIGCGLINFEVLSFVLIDQPKASRILLFDTDSNRALCFEQKCKDKFPSRQVVVGRNVGDVLASCSLISIATNATTPHMKDISLCKSGAKILHISLRDFQPEVILKCDNVVDDMDHVCRANTSIHLTEQRQGNRQFITCTLADILKGKSTGRTHAQSVVIFSPFGLGVLDIALGAYVRTLAYEECIGVRVLDFMPPSFDSDLQEKTAKLL